MDKTITLLKNSGLEQVRIENGIVYFQDPSCILPAFDTILHYAWVIILIFTGIMLFGWAVLYIKNGTNINTVFNNAKSLILIFCVLSVVKPIVNVVYGSNLFAQQCEIKQISMSKVQELLDMREKHFSKSDAAILYETFEVIDSGVKESIEPNNN